MTSLLLTPAALLRRHIVRPLLGPITGQESPLAGCRVLITGASSGVGEATAYAVARRGAHVVLVARRGQELGRVIASIRESGGDAVGHAVDLTDADAVEAMIATVLEDGPVDYLVNNAGRSIRRSLDLSYDRMHDFERTMAINYFSPVRLILGLLPAMREQGFGHVVNVVTWGVQIKAPKFAAYIASKSALDTFARIAGREAWQDNVTFTNVRLSLVRTAMVAPTEAYVKARADSPEQAAAKVVRALEDRPLTINTLIGSGSEVLNLIAPRLMDFALARFDARSEDSEAARG